MKPRTTPTSPKQTAAQGIEELYKTASTIIKPSSTRIGVLFMFLVLGVLLSVAAFAGLRAVSVRFPNVRMLKYFSPAQSSSERVVIREQSKPEAGLDAELVGRLETSIGALVKKHDQGTPYVSSDRLAAVVWLTNDGIGVTTVLPDLPNETTQALLDNGEVRRFSQSASDSALPIKLVRIDGATTPFALADAETFTLGQEVWVLRNDPVVGGINLVRSALMSLRDRVSGPQGSWLESSEIIVRRMRLDQAFDSSWQGAAVINREGRLVGLLDPGQGTSNAAVVPVASVRHLLTTFSREGRLRRPSLGLHYFDLSYTVNLATSVRKGAYVSGFDKPRLPAVVGKSAADEAGIRAGDIITGVDALQLNNLNSLSEVLASFDAGAKVTLHVRRGEKALEMPVTLGVTGG